MLPRSCECDMRVRDIAVYCEAERERIEQQVCWRMEREVSARFFFAQSVGGEELRRASEGARGEEEDGELCASLVNVITESTLEANKVNDCHVLLTQDVANGDLLVQEELLMHQDVAVLLLLLLLLLLLASRLLAQLLQPHAFPPLLR